MKMLTILVHLSWMVSSGIWIIHSEATEANQEAEAIGKGNEKLLKRKSLGSAPFLEVLQSDSKGNQGPEKEKVRGKLSLLQYVQMDTEDRMKEELEFKGIRCFCDTSDCVLSGIDTCISTGSCYTQILTLEDGSPPVTRGCINGETPLLCENRRPKTPGPYPSLRCCKSHFCNHPPPNPPSDAHQITRALEQSWTERSTVSQTHGSGSGSQGHNELEQNELNASHDLGRKERVSRPSATEEWLRISPLARAWLISAAASVILISAIGVFCLRREWQRTSEEDAEGMNDPVSGAHCTVGPQRIMLEPGKFKGHEAERELQKEMKSLMLPESVV